MGMNLGIMIGIGSGYGGGTPAPVTPFTPLGIIVVPGYANVSSRYVMIPHVKGGSGVKVFSVDGTLPAGLLWSTATGAIVGTPTTQGTYSGISITVTDDSGSVTSETFSIIVGAAAVSIAPSGDTTGATDTAAVNAALAAGDSVILTGHYYGNNIILQPSNTAIYCNSGEWTLVAGANCRMWCNTNQDSQTRTDNNLTVQGDGNFFFNGQPNQQTRQSNQRLNHGFDVISGNNVKLSGFSLNANGSSHMALGSTRVSYRDIILMSDGTTANQDGLDIGPGCEKIGVAGWRGIAYDDVYSFFAKTAQSSTAMWYGTPWQDGADTTDIYVDDTQCGCGLTNMFRLQCGNGFKLNGVYASRSINTLFDNDKRLIQFGESTYITVQPAATDYSNIVMDGASGFAVWVATDTACSGVKIRNINQNVALTKGIGTFDGNNLSRVVTDIVIDGVTVGYTGGVTHKNLIGFASGTGIAASNITFKNIYFPSLTNIVTTTIAITNLALENVAIGAVSGTQFVSTAPSTGTLSNVSVAKVQADVGSSGLTVASGIIDMSSVSITSSSTSSVLENRDAIVNLRANQQVTFSLLTGDDTALFSLSGGTLTLTAFDYEAPQDANGDNVYVCNLRADDGAGHTVDFSHSVTVRNDPVETFEYHPKVVAANALRSVPLLVGRKYELNRLLKDADGYQALYLLGRLYLFDDENNVNDGLINLANPGSLTATLPNGGTFTADRGIQLNGTNQSIILGGTWDADGKYSQNSAFLGVGCNLQGSGSGAKPHLAVDASAFTQMFASTNSAEVFRINGSAQSGGRTGTSRLGRRAGARINSTQSRQYYNGVQSSADNSTTSAAVSTGNAAVGQSVTTWCNDRFSYAFSGKAANTDSRTNVIQARLDACIARYQARVGSA